MMSKDLAMQGFQALNYGQHKSLACLCNSSHSVSRQLSQKHALATFVWRTVCLDTHTAT